MPPSDIPEYIYGTEALFAILVVGVFLIWHYQKGLAYSEFVVLHELKCFVFDMLNTAAKQRGNRLVSEKKMPPDEDEYVEWVNQSPKEVYKRISDTFNPHLLATAKKRPDGFAHSQWVTTYDRDGDTVQTEVYLFTRNGGTDIYAHVEPSVLTPQEHTETWQEQGDTDNKFKEAYYGKE